MALMFHEQDKNLIVPYKTFSINDNHSFSKIVHITNKNSLSIQNDRKIGQYA